MKVRRKSHSITKVPGQLMLWRSGFGYDLVEFVGGSELLYAHHSVKMLTGAFPGTIGLMQEGELSDITQAVYDRYERMYSRF